MKGMMNNGVDGNFVLNLCFYDKNGSKIAKKYIKNRKDED